MPAKKPVSKKIYRSEEDRMLAGVAGGIGEYFEVDSTIVRIILVLLTIFGGSGILIYFVLWVLMPSESHVNKTSDDTIRANAKEMKAKAKNFADEFRDLNSGDRPKSWLGIIIIVIGILFLTDNLGFLKFHLFWPLILIAIGILLLMKEK